MKSRKGFTLVEILIVVVILGILAAIVIPQFSQASSEAREASLNSSLQSVRAQIELYKMQHLDELPADGAALTTALTTPTDIDGGPWAAGDGTVFGPYMRSIPRNPFTTTAVIGDTVTSLGDWTYIPNFVNGTYIFAPDDDGTSPDGTLHINQ